MDYNILKKKSEENLKAAHLCLDNKLYNACVNRCYYAMFQIAVALLLKEITNYNNMAHSQVIGTFVKRYCNEQKIFPKFRNYLEDVQLKRNTADYRDRLIKEKEAKKILEMANEFVAIIISKKIGN